MIYLLERLTQLESTNVQNWVNLAVIYKETGRKQDAINAVNKVIEMDPGNKQYAEKFLQDLNK
jgi:Flp pilus assembly protein TadD